MSGEDEANPTMTTVKKAIAERLARRLELPDELHFKIKQIAEQQGRDENEVLTEMVLKGLSSSEEDIALILKAKLWRVCHISQIEIKTLNTTSHRSPSTSVSEQMP